MFGLAGYDLAKNLNGKHRVEATEDLKRSKHWIRTGAEITEICHESYIATPTRLGPDEFKVNNQRPGTKLIESGRHMLKTLFW